MEVKFIKPVIVKPGSEIEVRCVIKSSSPKKVALSLSLHSLTSKSKILCAESTVTYVIPPRSVFDSVVGSSVSKEHIQNIHDKAFSLSQNVLKSKL
eukprot:TRINITY_DN10896_c0_g1_i1.p1 TRINITY_DN10896_c0_g1~~TRINITY_DN10896_c0_g1_i1.p1  ORF type:complete len:111 (-),score=16.98 TRINITY_DN10896_c0_g1_i1:14-301(-)